MAKKYLGVKEIPLNQGFYDKVFEAKARRAGFVNGYAWCMITVEVILIEAIENIERRLAVDLSLLKKETQSEITPSTIQTWNNFRESTYWERTDTPEPGCIVIFVNTANRATGHAGIVEKVLSNGFFKSIEGNSNTTGSREGNEIVPKNRLIRDRDNKNLDVLGFIRLKDF